jgi:hypothetical protein
MYSITRSGSAPFCEAAIHAQKLATLEGGEFDALAGAQARAATLARRINNRLTNSLSKDPETTARALYIYDPSLCEPLASALLSIVKAEAVLEADLDAKARMEAVEAEETVHDA